MIDFLRLAVLDYYGRASTLIGRDCVEPLSVALIVTVVSCRTERAPRETPVKDRSPL